MKLYIAKTRQTNKGMIVEGIRYKKVNDKFVGQYVSVWITNQIDIDNINSHLGELMIECNYVPKYKAWKIKENESLC